MTGTVHVAVVAVVATLVRPGATALRISRPTGMAKATLTPEVPMGPLLTSVTVTVWTEAG